ncbi:hypothetical protein [Iodidimonas gelatinilytica]|uniref:hypothetical protein n=1 Tax=Iodidimonas gelatinilytica TaxID=1236966 RepID=UPI0012308EBD|nr:hypothetical protein [Iodidimonas gelatinilytica]
MKRAKLEREALNKQRKQRSGEHCKNVTASARLLKPKDGKVAGVWNMLRGEMRRIRKQNEFKAWQCQIRDLSELDALIFGHLDQRRELSHEQKQQHQRQTDLKLTLTDEQRKYEQIRKHLQCFAKSRPSRNLDRER